MEQIKPSHPITTQYQLWKVPAGRSTIFREFWVLIPHICILCIMALGPTVKPYSRFIQGYHVIETITNQHGQLNPLSAMLFLCYVSYVIFLFHGGGRQVLLVLAVCKLCGNEVLNEQRLYLLLSPISHDPLWTELGQPCWVHLRTCWLKTFSHTSLCALFSVCAQMDASQLLSRQGQETKKADFVFHSIYFLPSVSFYSFHVVLCLIVLVITFKVYPFGTW